MRVRLTLVALLISAAAVAAGARQQNPFLGAWNIAGTGPDSANVYWLDVKEDGGRLSGMFLNRTSSPVVLGIVRIENGELIFRMGTPEKPTGPEFRARIENGKLVGHHTVVQGGRGRQSGDPAAPPPPPPTERVINWVGVRPPVWPAANANGRHTYGAPVTLFDGVSLDMWGVQNPGRPMGWSIVDGVLTNAPSANNLVSKQTFTNFKVDAEYKLAAKSNSGIYLRGRYELQLLDDYGANDDPVHGHMAIYGRTPPLVNASKPADEWQAMEAVIVGNRVTVTLNGQRMHDNAVILGITGGALDGDELAPGPLMVQGDHSQVWIRKLVVTPIVTPGR